MPRLAEPDIFYIFVHMYLYFFFAVKILSAEIFLAGAFDSSIDSALVRRKMSFSDARLGS